MIEKDSLLTSPQLDYNDQHALALSAKQAHSLYKKSKSFGISFDVLEQVYTRGYLAQGTEKAGFTRVDSFIHGGKAAELDKDLKEAPVVGEPTTTDSKLPSSRFVGTPQLTNILKNETPGQQRAETIKRVIRDAKNK